jgi:unsaturated chondroitin disaccharide hydrolase
MTADSPLDGVDLESALEATLDRTDAVLAAVDDFPLLVDDDTGEWETTEDGNWCAGHWIGLLWLAAHHADEEGNREQFETAAYDYLDRMLGAEDLLGSMFAGMNYLYAGYRGYDLTGDRTLYEIGFTGADAMVDLFHERARMVPIGAYAVAGPSEQFDLTEAVGDRPTGEQISATDIIYTSIPVLWRAYAETGTEKFRDRAIAHCDRHLDWCIKRDGKTYHEVEFDPETGDLVAQYNDLAYSDDTCWARGQGWNIAGLSCAYNETGAERYLAALEETVGYYIEQTPDDLVPYWDFEDPSIPDAPRDTSAAALTAYGLSRLEGDDERVADLRETGEATLASLVEEYLVTDASAGDRGAVRHGTYNKPGDYGVDTELIWTNYYVAYALHERLTT